MKHLAYLIKKHYDNIAHGKGECVLEKSTIPKNRKQLKATNGSSTQQENSVPGSRFCLTLNKSFYR